MTEPDWVRHAIWWHVYPLGVVGAYPGPNRPVPTSTGSGGWSAWLDYVIALGASGSRSVRSSRPRRTGTTPSTTCASTRGSATTTDFDALVAAAHDRGLQVLLDGVFNHVGPGLPAVRAAVGRRGRRAGPTTRSGCCRRTATARVRRLRGPRRAGRAQPRRARGRRLRRRRDEPLAGPRRGRLAARRGVRGADARSGRRSCPGCGPSTRTRGSSAR